MRFPARMARARGAPEGRQLCRNNANQRGTKMDSLTGLPALAAAINASLVEREAEVDAVLRGLIAGEHVLLVGAPGIAKSALCRAVAQGIAGCRYCERLLSPTSAPETVFGPISLAAMREDRYEHCGAGTVTDAEIVFLDEFFRASDAIRDTLLHLLGPERQALVGTRQVHCPLISCIGAANTWAESADQSAILDRWLIRRTVRPVSPAGEARLLFDTFPAVTPVCTLADITAAQAQAQALTVAQDAKDALQQILAELRDAGICPSDRRKRASLKVARAAAVLEGSAEVQPHHLESLVDVLWDDPHEQPAKAAEIVTRIANPVGAKLNAILAEVSQITSDCRDAATRVAAIKKLEDCEKQAGKLAGEGNGRAAKCLAYVKGERIKLQAAALGIDPAKAAALLK